VLSKSSLIYWLMEHQMQGTVFLTDLPPIENGGIATHSIAWTMASVLSRDVSLVLTRKYHRDISLEPLRKMLGEKLVVYPDLSLLGLRKFSESLRGLLDAALFFVAWPYLARKLRQNGVTRIIALCGNHWSFLPILWLIKQRSLLSLELYMVDDLPASSRMIGRNIEARWTEALESIVLPQIDKVYTISRGYKEHLERRYRMRSCTFLPVPVRTSTVLPRKQNPAAQLVRVIGFSGSLNQLYQEPLRDLHRTIKKLNKENGCQVFKLRFFVVRKPTHILNIFEDEEAMDFVVGLPNAKLLDALSHNWANFLPYSFHENQRLMVSTAFSCKIAEYLTAGRPIMVYGPEYASVPKYFIENNIPLVEINKTALEKLIHEVDKHNQAGLAARYQQLLEQYHSPEALRRNFGFCQ